MFVDRKEGRWDESRKRVKDKAGAMPEGVCHILHSFVSFPSCHPLAGPCDERRIKGAWESLGCRDTLSPWLRTASGKKSLTSRIIEMLSACWISNRRIFSSRRRLHPSSSEWRFKHLTAIHRSKKTQWYRKIICFSVETLEGSSLEGSNWVVPIRTCVKGARCKNQFPFNFV